MDKRFTLSTFITVLLGWSVHRPNLALFFLGWTGSELVQFWMFLQGLNLYYLYQKKPSMFDTFISKFALLLNFWAYSKGISSLLSAFQARHNIAKVLKNANITPRAGKSFENKYGSIITSILSMVPWFYVSRRGKDLTIERHIPYANIEEIDPDLLNRWKNTNFISKSILQWARGRISQWMTMDVIYPSEGLLKNAPVLCSIHGGAWAMSDKLYSSPAVMQRIASRGVVVCVINYRMAPERSWPILIQDCKRAIIFIKKNVHKWGGDPNKIYVTGESAGGHLAALCGVTQNYPDFQPPEDKFGDTSIVGCLPLYGVMDLTNGSGKSQDVPRFTSLLVMQKSFRKNLSEFENASPIYHIRRMLKEENNPSLCPFFIPHGTVDVLTSYHDAEIFYNELQILREKFKTDKKDVFITMEQGHHAFGIIPSPRSNALADAMCDFIFHITPPALKENNNVVSSKL